ncbi:hypothetical protein AAG570_003815 [Ranatra chinensis]|uniref:Uncharacterized protein n=1 Tax=Ranatra chinensis TaxID=642074 RepID=A0ABD0Y4Q5_9HEMI
MLESGTWQWNVLATGGLSMAFERPVAPAASLSTSQEISNGVLKRGTVDVVLNHDTSRHSLFTLGLFSSGLSSFVSDSSSNNENEVVSAGLELRVAGVALRPFVFFNGQTELMGHVWSGTASSSTPAYQVRCLPGLKPGCINFLN